jgi:hypothetical protein
VLIFLLLVCFVLATSYRLRVYFRVTVAEVSVVRVASDGTHQVLPTPEQCRRLWWATQPPAVFLERLEHCIRTYMHESPLLFHTEPGARVEWVIRCAFNSTRLDQQRVIVFTADGSERF